MRNVSKTPTVLNPTILNPPPALFLFCLQKDCVLADLNFTDVICFLNTSINKIQQISDKLIRSNQNY